MARRSCLSGKDFLRGAFLLNPLRIRVLRSSGRSNLEQRRTMTADRFAAQPAERSPRYNQLRRWSPSVSQPERQNGRLVSRGPGNFPARLNVTVDAQPRCAFAVL